MYNYKCTFNFPKVSRRDGGRHSVTVHNDGLHNFTNGFWLTNELKFTKGSDCKFWIPPSQILYVEKYEEAQGAP